MPRTTRATPPAFPATDPAMDRFRRLVLLAILTGAIAGLALFVVQQILIVPLIELAETFEDAAPHAAPHADHGDEGWQPAPGLQRIGLTAVSTMLSGIAFAAMLLGAIALRGRALTLGSGALWGLAAFACFALAPALGLPPQPPGAAVADLYPRQLWWLGTVLATAAGLWLLTERALPWAVRALGLALPVLPHLIGAPTTAEVGVTPPDLICAFGIASIAASLFFWLLLGVLCGRFAGRREGGVV